MAAAHGGACDRWTGRTSQLWMVGSNWSDGVPSAGTHVCIDANGHSSTASLDASADVATVTVSPGAQLALWPSARLTLTGAMRISGTLTFSEQGAQIHLPQLTVEHRGSMSGVGEIVGSVVNAGRVLATNGGNGTPLEVSRSYTQLATGLLYSSDERDRFAELHAASASLAGALQPVAVAGLKPRSSYTLITAQQVKGRFSRVMAGYVVRYARDVVRAVVTPEIKLAHASVKPGKAVAVSGASFGPRGSVRLHLNGPTGVQIGSATVDDSGGFEGLARVPRDTRPGRHVLVAVKSPQGYTARATVVVAGG